MKAEIAVRSSSASISACAARMAPRTISSVTASQAVGRVALASGAGRSFSIEWSIRAILDEEQRRYGKAIADRRRGEAQLGRKDAQPRQRRPRCSLVGAREEPSGQIETRGGGSPVSGLISPVYLDWRNFVARSRAYA